MDNFLDQIVDSPVAFGAINGAMESFVLGRQAEKKEAREKEKAKAKQAILSKNNFVKHFSNNNEQARLLLGSPQAVTLLQGLDKHQKMQIFMSASTKPNYSEVTKKLINSFSNDPTLARNYVTASTIYNPNGTISLRKGVDQEVYFLAKLSSMNQGMSESENKMFKALTSKDSGGLKIAKDFLMKNYPSNGIINQDETNPDGELSYPPTTLNNSLFRALSSWIYTTENQEVPKELSDTLINSMVDAIEKAPQNKKLAVIKDFKDRVSSKDWQSQMFLSMAEITYGSKEGTGDTFKQQLIGMAKAIKDGTGLIEGEDVTNKYVQSAVVKFMEGDFIKGFEQDILELKDSQNPEDKQAYNTYIQLKTLYDSLKLADDNEGEVVGGVNLASLVGGNENLKKFADGKTGSTTFLRTMESAIKNNQIDLAQMKPNERNNLLTKITTALEAKHLYAISDKQIGVGAAAKTEKGQAINFYHVYPNLLKNQNIKEFVEKTLNMASAETFDNDHYIATKQVDDNNQELNANKQVRFKSNVIHEFSPHTVAFANAKGITVRDLFKEETFKNLIRANDGINQGGVTTNADHLFKHVTNIQKSGIFFDGELSNRNAVNKLLLYFVKNNIKDENDKFDIIAALMKDTMPGAWANRDPYFNGLSASVIEKGSKQLVGDSYPNPKEMAQLITSTRNFISGLEQAITLRTQRPGQASDWLNDMYGFALDHFLLPNSTIDVIANNLSNVTNIFSDRDVVGNTSAARSNELEAVNQTLTQFARTEFAKDNAQLASIMIGLAYNYARTQDPNGRISDADFKYALEALQGGSKRAPEYVMVSALNMHLDKANSQLTLITKANTYLTRVNNNTNNIVVNKSDLRALRALNVYGTIASKVNLLDKVEEYLDYAKISNFRTFRDKYDVKLAPNAPKGRNGQTLQIYTIHKKGVNYPISGDIDFFVDRNGKPLNPSQINQMRIQ